MFLHEYSYLCRYYTISSVSSHVGKLPTPLHFPYAVKAHMKAVLQETQADIVVGFYPNHAFMQLGFYGWSSYQVIFEFLFNFQ